MKLPAVDAFDRLFALSRARITNEYAVDAVNPVRFTVFVVEVVNSVSVVPCRR